MKQVSGTHCLAELSGCDLRGDTFTDDQACIAWLEEMVVRNHLTVLKSVGHTFENGGFTAVLLLAESHVSIHTWPEHGYVTLDVFACNYMVDHSQDAVNILNEIVECLKPVSKVINIVER